MNLIIKRVVAFYIDAFISATSSLLIYYFYSDNAINFSDLSQAKILAMLQSIILIIYYLITEYKFNTTLGKKIMRLEVVFFTSKEEKLKTTIIRTISRLIPFDILSFILNNNGDLWHDSLSKTKVISKKKTAPVSQSLPT
jgi:uncharacterized RDD family membrane protein YckC